MAAPATKWNLSFAGCGFLGIYHVGVASCFREYAPHVLVNHIAGASAGGLAACLLLLKVPLGESTSDVLRIAVKARSRALGPFHPGFDICDILYEGLAKMIPENAASIVNGRLHISVTRVSDGKNVLLTHFDSKEDLIQALMCSCFIPFYSGILPPKFHGVAYMDGGFSDNLPILDENTITVSPFCGESDICPQDNTFNLLQINLANTTIALSPGNLYRFARILFPPHPEILSKMCQQGFDDALRFLQRHNMISCTRCLAVQSSFVVAESDTVIENEEGCTSDSDLDHAYDDCEDCRYRQQLALIDSLPDAVVQAIQDASDQVNKGVINWLFRHRPMKLLSIMSIPYLLPIDLTIVFFCKVWQLMPRVQKELKLSLFQLLGFAKQLASKFNNKRHLYSAKFSCQLAITEFDYAASQTPKSYTPPPPETPKCRDYLTPKQHVLSDIKSKSMENISTFREESRAQRKSYAGQGAPFTPNGSRRKSMYEISRAPERVLSTLNFGFTVDVSPRLGTNKAHRRSVMEAFQSLSEGESDLNAIEMTNKALNWERECLARCQGDIEAQNSDTFERILDVTKKHDALMAYYYMDEDKRVKVTEIFNVTDEDSAGMLTREEQEVNSQLQWDTHWGTQLSNRSPFSSCSNLDNEELFINSDHDSPSSSYEEPSQLDQRVTKSMLESTYNSKPEGPKRKQSYLVANNN